jgi:hypothetical protein
MFWRHLRITDIIKNNLKLPLSLLGSVKIHVLIGTSFLTYEHRIQLCNIALGILYSAGCHNPNGEMKRSVVTYVLTENW